MKTSLRNKPGFKRLIGLGLLVLPILSLGLVLPYFIILDKPGPVGLVNPYNFLWLGFYSIILNLWANRKSLLVSLLIVLNIIIIVGFLFISLMGGIQGLLSLVIKILLPFLPGSLIKSLVFKILPATKYPPV